MDKAQRQTVMVFLQKKVENDMNNKERLSTKKIAQIGMLGAISAILMLFKVPLPFAPPFYKIDLSEVPVLIGAFAMGPAAGAFIELVKIVLNFLINGTDTAGVGEIANYLIGISMCIPAALVYQKVHSKKGAILGCFLGTVIMTVFGCFMNAYIMLPAYAAAFQLPLEKLVGMGTAVNENITSLFTFVVFAVAPFNLIKGAVVSVIVFLVYKKIRPILKIAQE